MAQISDLIQYLETLAPLALQESYDNCGLLVGNGTNELKGILITLDVTEQVVEEAVSMGCNVIVAHHPIIFKGLKKLTPQSYVERTVIAAIKHDVAIYAIHTNLDNVWLGVNHKIAQKLGLVDCKPLQTLNHSLAKLTFYSPQSHTQQVLSAIHTVGAGVVGNYTQCAFTTTGTGQFQPNEFASPYIGKAQQLEKVNEDSVEVVFPIYLQSKIIQLLKVTHPYEKPAFDVSILENNHPQLGAGRYGTLPQPMQPQEFIMYLKEKLSLTLVRHTAFVNKPIHTVALCGGSGSFLFGAAKKAKSDVFISSDFKYHEFFDADEHTMIADINHYEGEYFTKELIFEYLNQKFANIALVLSKVNTNPISYL